jgi:YD repeat-containing protein
MRKQHVEGFDRFRGAWQRLCRRWIQQGRASRPAAKVSLRCEPLESRETPNDLLGSHLGSLLVLGGLPGASPLLALASLPTGSAGSSSPSQDLRLVGAGSVNQDQPGESQAAIPNTVAGSPASETVSAATPATVEQKQVFQPSSLDTSRWDTDPFADPFIIPFGSARGRSDASHGPQSDSGESANSAGRTPASGGAASDASQPSSGPNGSAAGPGAVSFSAGQAQQDALLRAASAGLGGGHGLPPPPTGATVTNITASVEPATPGQLVTYTAVVQVTSPSLGVPTGQVIFSGAAQVDTPADLTWYGGVDGFGVATVQWRAPLEQCYFWIGAYYAGDDNYNPSNSTGLQVDKAPPPIPPETSCPCCNQPGDLSKETSSNSGNIPSSDTTGGVRASDGVVQITAPDLSSAGFGLPWGQTRSWSNGGYGSGSNGSGWIGTQTPALLEVDGSTTSTVAVITNGTTARYFDQNGNGYQERYFGQDTLIYDAADDQFLMTDTQGDQFRFGGFFSGLPVAQQGQLISYTDPSGNVTQVVSRTSSGQVQEVQRSSSDGGHTVTESYYYDYQPSSDLNAGLLHDVVLRRQIDDGSWSIVRQVVYSYYSEYDSYNNGNPGDLKTATIEDANGTALDVYYYRYYVPGDVNGVPHALKYAFSPQSYGRLVGAVGDPTQAGDDQVAPYADNYLEYDSQYRVTRDVVQGQGCSSCTGGLGAYTYNYTTSSNAAGANSWAQKTTETLPDGNQNVYYTNSYGEVMLKVYTDTTSNQSWSTFSQYDDQGRRILQAEPSAVTGYDDSHADLLVRQGSGYQYLSNDSGLLTRYDYYGTTTAGETTAGGVAGYQQDTALLHGQQGTPVLEESWRYYAHTAGSSTVYPTASNTVYRNETSNLNDASGRTTHYSYTWYPGTTQVQTQTTDKPVVSAAENGPGTADRTVTTYDALGREVARIDGGGYTTTTAYDLATGAVTQTVIDSGGLNLTTTNQVDALGRTVQQIDPDGHITYTVYDDADHEVRIYRGWDSTTGQPTGPTEVGRQDRLGGYTETLTTSDPPHLNAANQPDGTEQITAANLQSLSRSYTNATGQVVRRDDYYSFDGMDYTTDPYLGSQGTNYYTTQFAYDHRGRQDRITSPMGTITQTDYDGLGRVLDVQVGTVGTSLTMISQNHYDQSTPGGPDGIGDSNLTETVQLPGGGGAAPRVTQNFYDWRDRQVATKAGVQANEDTTTHRPITYTEYDNLGEVTAQERYDGDTVTITTSNGVPQKPPQSLRRSRTETLYDEQGRVYRTQQYDVSPTDGEQHGLPQRDQ